MQLKGDCDLTQLEVNLKHCQMVFKSDLIIGGRKDERINGVLYSPSKSRLKRKLGL